MAETIDPLVTEHLARLAVIAKQAEDVFGDPEVARAWLRSENMGLGGCTPLSMLDTDIGSREVVNILVAIAHGGAALMRAWDSPRRGTRSTVRERAGRWSAGLTMQSTERRAKRGGASRSLF